MLKEREMELDEVKRY